MSGLFTAIQQASPSWACACGAPVPPLGERVLVNEEASIISQSGGEEQIEMRLSADSVTKQSGLIFPTPAPATTALGSDDNFNLVDSQVRQDVKVVKDWWSWPSLPSFEMGSGAPQAGAPPHILSQVQLGPVQASTLKATDTSGLTSWLDDNGYGLRPEVKTLLATYVKRGWYFVALKMTGTEPLDGQLQPLRFTFASDHLVYPMALSQAATEGQTVDLYVFGKHKQTVSFLNGSDQASGVPIPQGTTEWAAPVSDPKLSSNFGPYLTYEKFYFGAPSQQITGDFGISQAENDSVVGPTGTEYVRFGPIPMGWLIVFSSFFVIGVVIIWAVVRRQRPNSRKLPVPQNP